MLKESNKIPIIEVEGLTKKFGTFEANKNISFTVDKGEIFGFLGANGAGKTTAIRILCGLSKPTSGKVKVRVLEEAESKTGKKAKVIKPVKVTK